MSGIRIKPSRTRKPTAPRTCCPTHPDTCRFGQQHMWCSPFYDRTGGGQVWRTDAAQCGHCDSICVDPSWLDFNAPALPEGGDNLG